MINIKKDTKFITICDVGKDENGESMVIDQVDYKLPDISPEMKHAICDSSAIGCDLDCEHCVVTRIIRDRGWK